MAAVGSRGQGENSCFPPVTPLALLNALWRFAPSGGASAPSVGLCPTPRFLLEAKRKRKAILLRKEEKEIRPTNYNFSFCSSNTLGRNYIGPSNRADMFQILIFRTNFLHCSLNATEKSGIINNRQREIQCRQLIWSEANEYTKEKAITYRKGSRDHC